MIKVIGSSEIISFIIVNNNNEESELVVPICKIRSYASSLEAIRTDLRVECDFFSIDAFRCVFKNDIVINDENIHIRNVNTLKAKVKRYLPSKDITELLIKHK